jgi:hypothetical protein
VCATGYIDDGAGGCMQDPNANEWAFFVFLNADNNLEEYGDLNMGQMESVGSTDYVHIVVLWDKSSSYTNARKVYVTQGGYQVLENMGEVDMSDWQSLADFGVWAVQNYPARHYALVLWDHGGGWKAPLEKPLFKGFSNDDHGSAGEISVSNGDYARALQAISNAVGGKIDLVGFDACLMGMWEVAEASAPYAHYLVASSETEPGDGWPYDSFLAPLVNNPTGTTAEELAISIVDGYYNASTGNSTMAVTNLDTIGALATAMTGFANALQAHASLYSQIETVRQATQQFYYFDDFRDLWDFAARVTAMSGAPSDLVTAANALIAQLGISIVYSRAQADYPGSHGLSVYLPARNSGVDADYQGSGAVWSQHTTWDEFLAGFAN